MRKTRNAFKCVGLRPEAPREDDTNARLTCVGRPDYGRRSNGH